MRQYKTGSEKTMSNVRNVFKLAGPNFIALLNGNHIFVLTVAEKFAMRETCIN